LPLLKFQPSYIQDIDQETVNKFKIPTLSFPETNQQPFYASRCSRKMEYENIWKSGTLTVEILPGTKAGAGQTFTEFPLVFSCILSQRKGKGKAVPLQA